MLVLLLVLGIASPAGATDQPDRLGLYNDLTGRFYLDSNGDGRRAELSTTLGVRNQSWQPLAGDFDGDGDDTVGAYSAALGVFYLRRSILQGPPESVVRFGPRHEDTVGLIGDWNGDGTDTVGVYEPRRGLFFLLNETYETSNRLEFRFGPKNSTRRPVVGDWTGDGTDKVGLYEPPTGKFALRQSNQERSLWIVAKIVGNHRDDFHPLAGDWDGDGIDTIARYDPAAGKFELRNSNTPGEAERYVRFGPKSSNRAPLSGHWELPVGGVGKESVLLAWDAPDLGGVTVPGRALAGFRIRYGVQAGSYPNVIDLADPHRTTFRVTRLPRKVLYFVVTAYDTFGIESAYSNLAIKRFE